MKRREQSIAKFIAAALVAASHALAQEQESKRRIVVSIPARKLALIEHGRVVKIYPAAVGASATPTPVGIFQIAQRIPHPTWYGPGTVVPPGKTNPLGTRWLGLSRKGYGIHGTNQPRSIGRRASHGCIRMRNADMEQLFELVKVGDVVELVAEASPGMQQIFQAGQ